MNLEYTEYKESTQPSTYIFFFVFSIDIVADGQQPKNKTWNIEKQGSDLFCMVTYDFVQKNHVVCGTI